MKNKKEVLQKIEEIISDERLHYKKATILENAPLALIQFEMETELKMLYWILGESMPKIERT